MTKEEEISSQLLAQFPFLEGQIKVQRVRRIWVETAPDKFAAVFASLVDRFSFKILCAITGQDEGEFFSIIYHLAQNDGIVLNLKVKVQKTGAKWKSIGDKFPGGIIYEREIADLLGVEFEGLPPGVRYPLPDDWPQGQYPLRKDWSQSAISPEGKAGQ
ncbi:MAG: NADH-quinone oxidoreductase subunit C [Kiritimatiellia bacterium]|nr:NADH-quinone oxidoreductase subunit C [Kiritimatiellia bacterium]